MIHAAFEYDNAKVLIWEVTETQGELLSEIHLPESVSAYEKISSEKRKGEFLAVRVALKRLLNEEIFVAYDEHGKPFLRGNGTSISISHSGKWVAVMVHARRGVGIDIECLNNKVQRVYTRFLCKAEQDNFSNGENLQMLQIAWSAKEAVYKIVGEAAVDFAEQLYVEPFELEERGKLVVTHRMSGKKYQLCYCQTDQYTLAYCID